MAKKPSSPNITIIVTISTPAKGGQRAITISGAPKGEMPEIRTGEFANRHMLLDQVYLALVKRAPLLVNTTITQAAGNETDDTDAEEKPTDAPAEPVATEPETDTAEQGAPEGQGVPVEQGAPEEASLDAAPELFTQSPDHSLTQ